MASPNTRALRARLDGLGVTRIVETPAPGHPNRAARRHGRTSTGKVFHTINRPTWTDRLRDYYRVLRFRAAQAKKGAA